MKHNEILFLTQEDTINAGALDMGVVVPTMEQVFSLHQKGDIVLPNKEALRWGDLDSESIRGRINSMPGYIGGDIRMAGIKWIASSPQNPAKYGIPRASALIILNDPETLVPVAVMEASAISAARTGANTGVAVKYFSRENSRVLGLIGAGVQNRTQMMAALYSRPEIEKIRIFDIDRGRAENFAKEMQAKTGREIEVCGSAAQAIRDADIYITATVTKNPIIDESMVKPGVLYSHVGSHECEFGAIQKYNKHFVDDWDQIKHRGVESMAIMYAKGMIDDGFIDGTMGEVINGVKPGRESEDESIYFNTVGMGIEDVALAAKVYQKAMEDHQGQILKLYEEPFAV